MDPACARHPTRYFVLRPPSGSQAYRCILRAGGDAEKPVRSVSFVLDTVLFGLQTLFFGILAELVVENRR